MGYTINGVNYDYDSIKNQKIKSKFVNQEVYCQANFIEYILDKSWEDRDAPFSWDDVSNYFSPICPDCSNSDGFYKVDTAFECTNCEFISKEEYRICPECNEYEDIIDEIEDIHECMNCGFLVKYTEELDTELKEIYQWFMVSDFLCQKLNEKGECVILNERIWGRQCCGQSISLDGVMSSICHDMGILEGMKYEWKV